MKIERYYSLKEVAERLGVSVDCVRRLVWKRRLAHTRIGSPHGRIRVSESDLKAYLERTRVGAYGE